MISTRPFYLFSLIVFLSVTIVACGKKKREFTRDAWSYGDGLEYPSRDAMLDDLFAKHKLVGLNHYQVIQLLGGPQDRDTVKFKYSYQIVNEGAKYNPNKNPVYQKHLIIYFSKDSIVTKTDVVEKNQKWK